MERMVKRLPYQDLNNLELFKKVKFEDKAIYWDTDRPTIIPLRFTVDDILLTIRDQTVECNGGDLRKNSCITIDDSDADGAYVPGSAGRYDS